MKRKILSYLSPDHPWRNQINCYHTISSTNTIAAKMAKEGAPHGTVLIADHQTEGHGRLQRSFYSPAGAGLYMSVILRPPYHLSDVSHLTCAIGVAACDAIDEVTGFRPGLKWINDLVANGKKLGGILVDTAINPTNWVVQYAVVGIGINCGQSEDDFPEELQNIACSLSYVTGAPVDRARLAAALISHFETMAAYLPNRTAIMDRYRRDCVTIGKEVSVIGWNTRRNGKALQVQDDGNLLVQYDDETTESVNSGEVSVRGLWGYL